MLPASSIFVDGLPSDDSCGKADDRCGEVNQGDYYVHLFTHLLSSRFLSLSLSVIILPHIVWYVNNIYKNFLTFFLEFSLKNQ